MGRIFRPKEFSYYLGEQRPLLGIEIGYTYEVPPPSVIVNYVVGGQGDNNLIYSNDGFVWYGSINGNDVLPTLAEGVAYNNGLWVAGGQNGNVFSYSYDGIYWLPSLNGDTFNIGASFSRVDKIIWDTITNKFLAQIGWTSTGTTNPATIVGSNDGKTWYNSNYLTASGGFAATSLSSNGTILVGGNLTTDPLLYSYNGLDWSGGTNISAFTTTGVLEIATDGSKFVATTNFGSSNRIVYSNDGLTWSGSSNGNSVITPNIITNIPQAITYGNGIWVVGVTGFLTTYRTATSTDGITWTGSTSANSLLNSILDIVYDGSKFIAVGSGANEIITSTDGVNWSATTNADTLLTSARGINIV